MIEVQVLINTAVSSRRVVFAKVNNKIAWLEHFDFEGHENCETNEELWEKISLSFAIPHQGTTLLVEIGTNNLDNGNNKCGESVKENNKIGLDDFVLYIK